MEWRSLRMLQMLETSFNTIAAEPISISIMPGEIHNINLIPSLSWKLDKTRMVALPFALAVMRVTRSEVH